MIYDEMKKKLEGYGQEHLLQFYDDLTETEKTSLFSQLTEIDYSLLNLIGENESMSRGKITPIETLTQEEVNARAVHFYDLGIDAIKAGKVGAILLAGGQGTRLGFDKPKGTLNVGIEKTIYLFELLVQNLLEVSNNAGAFVPLFVMTSEINHQDTTQFFRENNYFGYPSNFIFFFIQDMTPSVDFNGKILLEDKARVSLSPNGNGGWYSSLLKSGLLTEACASTLEWLNVFSVDNVLQKIADPYFVGATIESGCASGAKVVKKAYPEEKVGVLCLEDGMPSIIEYFDMTEELMYAKNQNGDFSYNYGVILNYLFRIDELNKLVSDRLPIHVVTKKIPYINEQGEYIKPDAPNGYKFEELVLDMVHRMGTCLPYEVIRNKEFAPIKNRTGVDSLDTARDLLIENGFTL